MYLVVCKISFYSGGVKYVYAMGKCGIEICHPYTLLT